MPAESAQPATAPSGRASAGRLPRLHLITDDAVLGASGFVDSALAIVDRCGGEVALHVRGHATVAVRLHELAVALARAARRSGAVILVNDRVDVALVTGTGVQLGARSISPGAARALLGADARVGYSAHGVEEARAAVRDGADFVFAGTVWQSASHAGRAPAGAALVRAFVDSAGAAVIGIGGVTVARLHELAAAGAHGGAVLSGVWHASDPVAAADEYVAAARQAWTGGGRQRT